MRVPPQVSDRIKEAPAQALRGVFAGIGQLLLITDKLRNKRFAQVPPARAPRPAETRADPVPPGPSASPAPAAPLVSPVSAAPPVSPAPAAPPVSPVSAAPPVSPVSAAPPVSPVSRTDRVTEARDLDKTGNVRLLTSEEARAGSMAPTVDATTPVSADAAVTEQAAEAAPVADAEPDVPLPNYDDLSIASLRARLRNLDAAQVKQLAEYERAHSARADVITMFERRMAKLEAGD